MNNFINFNKKHPELQDDEVWLTNYWPNREGWKPEGRFGKQAYDIFGNKLSSGVPVFVKKSVLKERINKK